MASTLTTTPTPTHDVDHITSGDTTLPTTIFRPPPTRRSPSSLSSSPSHSSNSSFGSSLSFHDILDDHNNSPISPTTPLHFPKGVPFSWEKIPGIPKQVFSKKNINNSTTTSLGQLLPLMPPPAGNNNGKNISNYSSKKISSASFLDEISPRKSAAKSFRKDPFFAAFVECSKDDNQQYQHDDIWKNSSSKVPSIRSLSDRFGFISMYTSCKRTCTVSESIVYLPRSRNYSRKQY
ncbi:putative E3 ubiquitin-protein ligase RNF13-like [Capsicum annuum]|uniref:Uncharacterized protein n=1 Tax=Capsicum annuum TaxID=4072 RepID=A0A1U8H7I0_CAPAN|nr:uncharacterized protein LOC107874830 [Capsicum annuum]KAF3661619.1 putative E3 ubiquitin-protein ligase RNF13-like [Capsicum annuum]KAF3673713.1 putative E3 ubiquitin-protein ligase RNF13-like [Capsicum annuum]PHT79139.1 hypothetical protein T459_17191 [Capsicum annuum]